MASETKSWFLQSSFDSAQKCEESPEKNGQLFFPGRMVMMSQLSETGIPFLSPPSCPSESILSDPSPKAAGGPLSYREFGRPEPQNARGTSASKGSSAANAKPRLKEPVRSAI